MGGDLLVVCLLMGSVILPLLELEPVAVRHGGGGAAEWPWHAIKQTKTAEVTSL